jgi:hypothetical protein
MARGDDDDDDDDPPPPPPTVTLTPPYKGGLIGCRPAEVGVGDTTVYAVCSLVFPGCEPSRYIRTRQHRGSPERQLSP